MPELRTTGAASFFDVDETLVALKSMASFLDFHRTGRVSALPTGGPWQAFVDALPDGIARHEVNSRYYALWRGERLDAVHASARRWWATVSALPGVLVPAGVAALAARRAAGDRVVLVSGSFEAPLAPIAEQLGADDVICTVVEHADGVLTGRTVEPMIGDAKARAVQGWMWEHGLDPAVCSAYGDHESDVPMLEAVGRPHVVGGSPELHEVARQRGWSQVEVPA